MTKLATYSRSGRIATIVMDDGKANVMSLAMLNSLHAAFDEAERDKVVPILKANGKHFSGGFDLNVFAKGSAEEQYLMLRAGAELALRILSFPFPVVAACHGNAYPMGAFLIMSSDHRIAAEGDYRIGMNEVAIGIVPPRFAIEIARQRLTAAAFNRLTVTGEMVGPTEAAAAGFLDQVVAAEVLHTVAREAALGLAKLDMKSHAATKLRVREPALRALRAAIASELTLDNARALVAARDG